MIAAAKPGAALAHIQGPMIETPRLKLRQWMSADIKPYSEMLADPGVARFITVDGKPVVDEMMGWRHAAVMTGHWALHGFGMFAVEEKATGRFIGRVGPWIAAGMAGLRNRLGHCEGSAGQRLRFRGRACGDRMGV